MAELVRDHVGLCEVARRAEPVSQLPEELEVEVHLPVGRAVERAGGRGGGPAARLGGAAEEDERGRLVLLASRREGARPGVLDVVDDEADELHQVSVRVFGRRDPASLRSGHLLDRREAGHVEAAASTAEDPAMEEDHDDRNDEADAAEAALGPDRHRPAHAAHRAAAAVLDLTASYAASPLHDLWRVAGRE